VTIIKCLIFSQPILGREAGHNYWKQSVKRSSVFFE